MRISDWSSDVCSSDLGQQSRRSGGHDGLPAFDPGAGAADSTLGRLYQIGRRELTERLAEGRASGSRFAIRAQSIAAIRPALDAGQGRASQKLNKQKNERESCRENGCQYVESSVVAVTLKKK